MEEKQIFNEDPIASEEQGTQEEQVVNEDQKEYTGKADTSQEEKLVKEVAELKDKYLRLYSEFENYRRRTAKERIDLIKTASEDLMTEILPVVDDFERAFRAHQNETDASKVREGNQLVFHKLLRILEQKGLKPMESLVGKPFDAETQEAITQIASPNEEMKGKVIDVIENGYTLGDKVIRFAKVVIGA
ncbi:nucleotide exchange factor GrpE [Aquiflexum sp. LQ15W]|uniref:nucleotide exchange factor GrpE n=1 Tax=Cognataquiflexum nitidum TaxID=2922272 RepID=UPI001F12D663|nr:nucleotide exchange factor GrpE [Cognataquiflexum nitidum]MCH6198087.1 nucleotide exchange factor GrpE [Cognataquiflexum nitidum]